MNARQQLATSVIAVLMLGTIMMMPARFGTTYSASAIRQVGMVSVSPEVRAELPHEQVRDLTYN
jgi:hypothetical protein